MGTRNPAPSLQRPMRKCFVCGDCGPCACRRTAGGLGRHRLKRRAKGRHWRVCGWGVKTYTSLQADGKGQDVGIGSGWDRGFWGLGRNPPSAQPEDTTTGEAGAVVWSSLPQRGGRHPRRIYLVIQIHAIFTRDSCHFHPAYPGRPRFMPFSPEIHAIFIRHRPA